MAPEPPHSLPLKASATNDTGGELVSSKAWKVKLQQRGLYTGGKIELLPPGAGPAGEDVVTSLYGSDVVLSKARNGQVIRVISCGEGEGKEEIVTFAVHPKGHEIATASRNLMLRFWDWRGPGGSGLGGGETEAGAEAENENAPRCTRAFKAHETPVLSMAYDATGTLLATGGSDRAVKVWDVPGGFCTHNFRGHEGIVTLVRFHPDPQRELLFSCADDTTVRVWTLAGAEDDGRDEGGQQQQQQQQKGKKDRTKQQPPQQKRKKRDPCLQVLTDHMSAVTGVGVSRDGRTLVTAGRDQVVSLWALEGRGAGASVALLESLPVYEAVEGLLLLEAGEARALGRGRWDGEEFGGRVPEAEQAALHRDRHKRQRGAAAAAAASKGDGGGREGAFVLAGAKGKVRVFYFKPKTDAFAKGLAVRCVAEQGPREAYPRGYSGLLRGNGGDGHLLAVTADHNVHWLHGGSLRRRRVLVGYNDQIVDVKYLGRDGRRVAVASNSPQVRIFGLADLGCEGVLEGQHTETVLSLDASPDGRYVLTGGKDRTVCLWRVDPCAGGAEEKEEEGEGAAGGMLATVCLARYEGHADAVSAVALTRRKAGYAPGGAALAFSAGTDRTLKRWALQPQLQLQLALTQQGQQQQQQQGDEVVRVTEATASVLAHEKDINALAVAPNDALVASASQDKTVKVWDARRLAAVGTLRGHKRGVWSVEFSPVDRCLVSGSGDRTVRLWSLADFSCLRTLEGHGAAVLRATFLRSGLQLLSAGADGLLKLWTARTQECEATLDGHEERVWALALAPSGRQAVTGGGDSRLNVWEDVTAAEEAAALAAAEALVEKEQALANSVHRKDYRQAVRLALELGRPFRLFKVLQEVMEAGTGTNNNQANATNPIAALGPFVREWSDAEVGLVLGYAREWNTNAKHAFVAQAVLQSLLRLLPHARLKRVCAAQPAVLHGLLAYTERHLQRADRLLEASFLADYTLNRMQLLFPEEDAVDRPLPPFLAAPTAALVHGNARPTTKAKATAEAVGQGNGNGVVVVGRPGGYGSSSSSEDEEEEGEEDGPQPPQEEGGQEPEESAAPAAAATGQKADARPTRGSGGKQKKRAREEEEEEEEEEEKEEEEETKAEEKGKGKGKGKGAKAEEAATSKSSNPSKRSRATKAAAVIATTPAAEPGSPPRRSLRSRTKA